MAGRKWRIHSDTKIASDFTVGEYKAIRPSLDLNDPLTPEWSRVRKAFQRRIYERFLLPIREMERHDKKEMEKRPTRAGFAIMALDCLLIDTIQSFREGRISTGEVSSSTSFRSFLKSKNFAEFKRDDRDDFVNDVRNGLIHNAETRRDWKITIGSNCLLSIDTQEKTRTINRRIFHCRVLCF